VFKYLGVLCIFESSTVDCSEVKDIGMAEKECTGERVAARQMHLASRRALGSSPVPLCTLIRRTYSQEIRHATLSDSGISSEERSSAKKHKYRSGVASASSQWPGWNLVVGIEVHAQLKTRRKLFSSGLLFHKAACSFDGFSRLFGSGR
jgi:hypothetical protein